jgi:hypothetical protein
MFMTGDLKAAVEIALPLAEAPAQVEVERNEYVEASLGEVQN